MTTISDNSVFLNLGNTNSASPAYTNATTANLQQEANTTRTSTSQLLSNVGLQQIGNTLDLISSGNEDALTYNLVSMQNNSNTFLAAQDVSDEVSGAVNKVINVTI